MLNLKNSWIESKKKEIFNYKSVIKLLKGISINEVSYSDLLKCFEWQYKRFKILVRDGFTCGDCRETSYSLHVHHKYYLKDKLPWEIDDLALVSLCVKCHTKRHENESIYVYKEVGNKLVLANNHFSICPRCNGTGYLPQFKHVEDGICFLCFGNVIPKTIFSKRLTEISTNPNNYDQLHEECIDFLDSISLDFYSTKILNKFKDECKIEVINIEIQTKKEIEPILEPCYSIIDNEKKYGYMYSKTRKIAIKCQFEKTYPFNGDFAKVLYKGNIIYVNFNGFFIQPNDSFYGSSSFKYGIVPAYASRELNPLSNEKIYGYVDIQSDKLIQIPFEYNSVNEFMDGYAVVKKGINWGVIDINGNIVIPIIYEWLNGVQNQLFVAKLNDKWGVIDINNNQQIPIIYDTYWQSINESYHTLSKEGKFGFYNVLLNKFYGLNYDGASQFSENCAPVKIKGKWGYIDKSWNTILPFDFDEAKSFRNGIAAVKKGKLWGYININGDLILPYIYKEVGSFRDEIAQVEYPLNLKQKFQIFIGGKYERVVHKININGESISSWKSLIDYKNSHRLI
jgi:hypothetical protein